jgi:DNA-binding NarL/FixJ family response regulator
MVRILLVDLTGILKDIVRSLLEEQDDMTVVGWLPDHATLREAILRTTPEVLVWGMDDDANVLDVAPQLFGDHPTLKVFEVRDDGRQGFLWELRPHRTTLGEISPLGLVAAIRTAASTRGGQGDAPC